MRNTAEAVRIVSSAITATTPGLKRNVAAPVNKLAA
jgi:hypothetical protein